VCVGGSRVAYARHAGGQAGDADGEDGEDGARRREVLRATLASRRAFEAEAEEDEYDRYGAVTPSVTSLTAARSGYAGAPTCVPRRLAMNTYDPRNRVGDSKPLGDTEVRRRHSECWAAAAASSS
jgi:hypothetical protein